MAFTANNAPVYYSTPILTVCQFGSTAVTTIPSHSTVSTKTNTSVDTALLVPANANQPQEFPLVFCIPRGNITGGTLMLLMDDQTTVHLISQISPTNQTITTTAGATRITFSDFSTTYPLLVPATYTVYIQSTIAQSSLFDGFAIGGMY